MGMDGLKLALYFHPPCEAGALAVAQRAVRVMGEYRGERLVPFATTEHLMTAERDEAFEAGQSYLMLTHPSLRPGGWWSVKLWYLVDAGWSTLDVVAAIEPYDRTGAAVTWAFMMEMAPKIVSELRPTFALIGGIGDMPDPQKLEVGALPRLLAWNYFSSDVLPPARREALVAVPGLHRLEPLGDGLIVQVVPDLYTKAPKGLAEALAQVPNPKPPRYKAPVPPKG